MNDTTTAAAAPKAKTVIENMDDLRHFDSASAATAYLIQCANELSDFGSMVFVTRGVITDKDESGRLMPQFGTDENGQPVLLLDDSIFTPDMRIAVKVLSNRLYDDAGKFTGSAVKAIVIAPQPTIESVLANEAARAWVQKILDKELTHVMVRPIRNSENPEASGAEIPATLEAYITSSRGGEGGAIDVFNKYWQDLKTAYGDAIPAFKRLDLKKADLKKAMESKGFAEAYFPHIEAYGPNADSIFALMIQTGAELATENGDDPAIFNGWLESRDSQKLDPSAVATNEAEPDAGSIMAALKAKKAKAAEDAAAAEAAKESTEAADPAPAA